MILGASHVYGQYPLPQIPDSLTDTQARVQYLATHYWDAYPLSWPLPGQTEQLFVDFVDLLQYVEADSLSVVMEGLADKASANDSVFVSIVNLAEKYLCDPNSPLRNENAFIPLLAYDLGRTTDEVERCQKEFRLKMMCKNRVGEQANDFTVALADDSQVRLSAITTPYTLLFFNNPACADCRRVKAELLGSVPIQEAVRNGQLTVLAVYPDSDLAEWRKAHYPSFMLNGYDEGCTILHQGLYDLKAMPTLYLLGHERKVLLKDSTVSDIAKHLIQPR